MEYNKKLKIVFVDWYKTLSSSIFFSNIKNDEMFVKLMRKRTFEDNVHLMDDWVRGKISKKDILEKISTTQQEYLEAEASLIKSCENMKFDSDDYLPLLQKIRQKGIKVVIATDNMDVFKEYVVPAMQLDKYFDAIISSAETGYVKKDVIGDKMLFFYDYLQKQNCAYHEAIMLDDITNTIELCKRFGMNGQVIEKPEDLLNKLREIAD